MTTEKGLTLPDGICFVIMPFGGYFDSYYESIYKPAISNAGLEPRRADDLYRPSPIVKDIWELTKTAKVLLADLTFRNPNVFYELGLAHAIGKPVILVSENLEDVPFDLKGLRTIEYDKNEPNWGEVLQERIRKSITETLSAPSKSIVAAFLDETDLEKQTVTQDEKALMQMKQDIELLKKGIYSLVNEADTKMLGKSINKDSIRKDNLISHNVRVKYSNQMGNDRLMPDMGNDDDGGSATVKVGL